MPVVSRRDAAEGGLRALEQAAFPTGGEWAMWWREHERRLQDGFGEGWEKALGHAIGRLMDNQLTLARQIRLEGAAKVGIRYDSTGHVIGEETRSSEDITREAFLWWLHGPRTALLKDGTDEAKPGIPEPIRVLAKAVEGCFIQQCRLGIELTAIKKKGYITLNHSATSPNAEAFDERFTETL